MPSPLTMPSMNYDYDYDTVQPYFLDGEEENFYPPPCSQLLPGPGEDIWKKFELLPTPPLSPRRRPSLPDASLSPADHLEAVTDLLDKDSAALLESFIIQDCMWSSSFAAAAKLESLVSERLASLQARRDSAHTDQVLPDQQVCSSEESAVYLEDLHHTTTDCIDPSAMFQGAAAMEVTSELNLESPPLSSSDSESDEDEEQEEVDVVTVDKRRTPTRPQSSSRSFPSPLVLKRSHMNVHQHNYAAQHPAGKRTCSSPRSDSSEDGEDRRRMHNVLERQRRNELKRSFLALRDEIPALANNHRAAKVLILKTATAAIEEARREERRLLTAKDKLRRRSRELRRRLKKLRTL